MSTSVNPIPASVPRVTPYLTVRDAPAALAWYAKVFAATETLRLPRPDGTIAHAELCFGDTPVMLTEEAVEHGCTSPTTAGATTVTMVVYVADPDAVMAAAVAAGGTALQACRDEPHGHRTGRLRDPFGHEWLVSAVIEDLTTGELTERYGVAAADR